MKYLEVTKKMEIIKTDEENIFKNDKGQVIAVKCDSDIIFNKEFIAEDEREYILNWFTFTYECETDTLMNFNHNDFCDYVSCIVKICFSCGKQFDEFELYYPLVDKDAEAYCPSYKKELFPGGK